MLIPNCIFILGNEYREAWKLFLKKSPVSIIMEKAKYICANQYQVEGNAPIHLAALMGNVEIFRNILKNSSNKDHSTSLDCYGRTL